MPREKHRLMSTYLGMLARCNNPRNSSYSRYGGRGIEVCTEWQLSFELFVSDMGYRPEGMTLERKDNDKGYCKDNCRWASWQEQANNKANSKRVTYQQRKVSIRELSNISGIPYDTLRARLTRSGYSVEDAVSKPLEAGKRLEGAPRNVMPKGVHNPKSKLSFEQVLNIREERIATGALIKDLAAKYLTSATTVSEVLNCKGTYKEVK